MPSKKKNPAAPAENNQVQTQTETQPRKQRTPVVIQPEIGLEIENCKKRILSLKALNKLTPIINAMDKDAIGAMRKIIAARIEALA